jgi:hypothetical protein
MTTTKTRTTDTITITPLDPAVLFFDSQPPAALSGLRPEDAARLVGLVAALYGDAAEIAARQGTPERLSRPEIAHSAFDIALSVVADGADAIATWGLPAPMVEYFARFDAAPDERQVWARTRSAFLVHAAGADLARTIATRLDALIVQRDRLHALLARLDAAVGA